MAQAYSLCLLINVSLLIIPIYLFSEIFHGVGRGPICSSCTRAHSLVWPPLVQDILARVVVGTSSSLNIRRDLHWLPVGHRISYKLCLITWKTIYTSQPLYLSELVSYYLPPLRSSNTNLLTRPAGITSSFPLGHFLCLQPLLGTLCLHTFVLPTPCPLLNAA